MNARIFERTNVGTNGTNGHRKSGDDRKARLLADAATKPVRPLAQLDGWPRAWDDAMESDKDGDCFDATTTDELRNSACVRLQYPQDMPMEDVVRVVRKMLHQLEGQGVRIGWDEEAMPF
ncbi:MAG: hypothetical protein M1546_19970 [Chloroflexi bacterium]|nr:hypothetical protein [Chloroflexota bacterium]